MKSKARGYASENDDEKVKKEEGGDSDEELGVSLFTGSKLLDAS